MEEDEEEEDVTSYMHEAGVRHVLKLTCTAQTHIYTGTTRMRHTAEAL